MKKLILTCLALAGLGACGGSMPVPSEQLAQAEAAERSARELGAEKEPSAALQIKLADDEIALAKRYLADSDNERATATLLRARADAELAVQISKEVKTRLEAQAAETRAKSVTIDARGGQ